MLSEIYSRDHRHDAIQIIVKSIRKFQVEGRHWLAGAYSEALDKLLDKDDGESAAVAINYTYGFEAYCRTYLEMDPRRFEPVKK